MVNRELAAQAFGQVVTPVVVPTHANSSRKSAAHTAAMMAQIAKHSGMQGKQTREIASHLLGSLPRTHRQPSDCARAVYWWVKRTVSFIPDETFLADRLGNGRMDVEMLIHPEVLLGMEQPEGDCDDFSTLTAALLVAMSVPCSFRMICADEADPERFSHIYVMADCENGRLAMDTSHGSAPGWEYDKPLKTMELRVL